MNEDFRLGRIAGIPVGVSWSVLVVLWLIAWSLAARQLPDAHPGHSTGAYWLVGGVAAVLFLVSLLAHEIGHSLVAKHYGLGVERITLWLFGGVAMLKGEPESPSVDFRIAVIGPVVSLMLAAVFAVMAGILDAAGALGLIGAAAAWLALMNLILGVFNLIPAAPLDGGRVLRAVLWGRHGDRARAADQAVRSGRTFGYILIGFGVVQFAAGAGIGGLWFVFIGWFLLNAATAEASQALLRDALTGVPVSQVMTPDPITAPDDLTVAELLEDYVMAHRASAFPLVDATGTLTGLVTLARIKRIPADQRRTTEVKSIACPRDQIPIAHPDDPLLTLIDHMVEHHEDRALVMVSDRLVGIITPTDLNRTFERAALRPGSGRPGSSRVPNTR